MSKASLASWVLLMAFFVQACNSSAGNLGGNYVAADGMQITMTLSESSDGTISGTLAEPGMSLPISARRNGSGFSGTVGTPPNGVPFTATQQDSQVILNIGSGDEVERIAFTRTGKEQGGTIATARPPATTNQEPSVSAKRNVIINEQRLSDLEISQIEQVYRVRIGDADYWYDPVLGAWGVKGSPTMGFIAPGLRLGGSLRADASGGGTGVFVNGRELHPYDVMALQQITGPILPGRYFITAQGLAGYEGGPPMWNLAAMAAPTPGGGGGSHTWQSRITGASGFSDGTTGAVFLPNGGIVSTGQ